MSIVIVTIYTFSFVFVIYSCDLQFLLINLDDMYLLTKMLFAGEGHLKTVVGCINF